MLERLRAKVAVLLALGAVVALMVFALPSQGADCPDGSTATNVRGEKVCATTTTQGAPNSSSQKTTTSSTQGSFNSSHDTTSVKQPPPKGKTTVTP
jgi:hypothetical protein